MLGYRGFDFTFSQDPAPVNYYSISTSSKGSMSFQIFFQFTDPSIFRKVTVNYLIIYDQFGTFSLKHCSYVTNTSLTGVSYDVYVIVPEYVNFTNPYLIQPSLTYFSAKRQNTYPYYNLITYWTGLSLLSNITISVYGYNLFLEKISFDILILEANQLNDLNRRNIILSNLDIVSDINPILSQERVNTTLQPKTAQNCFIGIFAFSGTISSVNFLYYTDNNKLFFNKVNNTWLVYSAYILIYQKACIRGFGYDENINQCIKCPLYCEDCIGNKCIQCKTNFTLSVNKTSCDCSYQIISGICFDFNSSQSLIGCIAAVQENNQVICKYCSPLKKLIAQNGKCICKSGYTKIYSLSSSCKEICGDGIVFDDECDDGNINNNDGCSSQCKLEQPGFDCIIQNNQTFCTSTIQLQFQITSILKNEDNSAILCFTSAINNIPFNLQQKDFTSFSSPLSSLNNSFFNLQLINSNSDTYVTIPVHLINVQNNQVCLEINYEFTIEGMDAFLDVNMSQSRYRSSEISSIHFKAKGDNFALKCSAFLNQFKTTSISLMIAGILMLFTLLIGLFAPKYIGLEAILTIQLIYYSQLLICQADKWPIGFIMFQYLKLGASGFNDIFKLTSYSLGEDINKKYGKLSVSKSIIENFNVSFAVLSIAAIGFIISLFIRKLKEKQFLENDNFGILNQIQIKKKQKQLKYWIRVNEFSYQSFSQISVWCIIQILIGIAAEIRISNNSVNIAQINSTLQIIILHFSSPIALLTIFLIFIGLMNNYANIFLSEITLRKIEEKPAEQNYKKLNFVYILLIGCIISFFNDCIFFGQIPISLFVILIHILYMFILILINPYKLSLRIHSIGLGICQVGYFIFLILINIINFNQEIQEIYVLALGYLLLLICFILIILTVIRLYYEYRYGEALQKQIQKKRDEDEKLRMKADEEAFRKKMKQYQQQVNKNINLKGEWKIKNKYLYENQIKEDQMNDLLDWLDTKKHWTTEMKEEYYFKRYSVKPRKWIQKQPEQNYKTQLLEQQQQIEVEKEKTLKKSADNDYKKILKQLKKSLISKIIR